MRWINTAPKFLPYLSQIMGLVCTSNGLHVSEFDDTAPVAGAIFDGYNGKSIHSHLWIAPGRNPSRAFWFACFDYMFRQCGVETVIGTVPSSNVRAQKLDEHLGYRLTATIPNYYPNGDDMLLYVCTPATAPDWQKFKPRRLIHYTTPGDFDGQQSENAEAA